MSQGPANPPAVVFPLDDKVDRARRTTEEEWMANQGQQREDTRWSHFPPGGRAASHR